MIPPQLLERLPLLLDGRPGDWLRLRHPDARAPIEALNLSRPDWVREAHRAFFAGGARALRTNTHAASALALAAHGLEERCEAVNGSGAACVREAVGRQAVVLGAIGEVGPPGAPGLSDADRARAYGQLAVYLSDLGCDAVLLDEFHSVAECLAVLRAVRSAGDAPVLAALAVTAGGRSGDGLALARAAERLAGAGMDAIGLVFGCAAAWDRGLVEEVRACGLPLAILQHARALAPAGRPPGAEDGPPLHPAAFAERLAPFGDGSAILLGGGAGATPAHIAALADRLRRG